MRSTIFESNIARQPLIHNRYRARGHKKKKKLLLLLLLLLRGTPQPVCFIFLTDLPVGQELPMVYD